MDKWHTCIYKSSAQTIQSFCFVEVMPVHGSNEWGVNIVITGLKPP